MEHQERSEDSGRVIGGVAGGPVGTVEDGAENKGHWKQSDDESCKDKGHDS